MHQGKLILDATVAEQAIRYPTDLSLLNEVREFIEQVIDRRYPHTGMKKKPRTYRERARVDHLCWDAFHEGNAVEAQVAAYRARYGVYPEVVLGDPIYGETTGNI